MSEARKRFLWVAIPLALFSPFLSMLYSGRGIRALVYLLAGFASVGAALLLKRDSGLKVQIGLLQVGR